jgi:hypothetical protein
MLSTHDFLIVIVYVHEAIARVIRINARAWILFQLAPHLDSSSALVLKRIVARTFSLKIFATPLRTYTSHSGEPHARLVERIDAAIFQT